MYTEILDENSVEVGQVQVHGNSPRADTICDFVAPSEAQYFGDEDEMDDS